MWTVLNILTILNPLSRRTYEKVSAGSLIGGGSITPYHSIDYILITGRSAAAGCLFAYRPCNSPAGGVRATAISSGHRVRRCGHFGLTCRRTPAHNALCGSLTPQVIFTKPESFAVAMLPHLAPVIRVCSSDGLPLRSIPPTASGVPLTRNLSAAGPSRLRATGGYGPLEEHTPNDPAMS